MRVETCNSRARLVVALCCAVGAWAPIHYHHQFLQPTASKKPITWSRLSETSAGGLSFRVEFPYGRACNDAGGQQSGRSSRPFRVFTSPGPLLPTCIMTQHLFARAPTPRI
ncbi:hypothetical protein M438DRAFT_348658 [Aureobasidium pullulans EXF-150]|uniref:Uncharacterized protein n=1 Tax=Aureobasidium pullulans EXF-150 TaxID=1043002 RepID=A0A074XAI5_AURPU|nr:uncharacterized protein M438DRAFT_348658 [Aureobasidium pullulans EXF-150]KEQ80734.1 hypothetical protein M438DRAFT_348658 [Aureobasidium pullulans EXF-150]